MWTAKSKVREMKMSRTFDFSYEGLTRDDPYEAIFIDYMNSDFNFTVKKIESGYSITCCFREFTLNTETLELLSSERQLTESERALAQIFIREKDEYMRSPEFETAMSNYQRDLEMKHEEERPADFSFSM